MSRLVNIGRAFGRIGRVTTAGLTVTAVAGLIGFSAASSSAKTSTSTGAPAVSAKGGCGTVPGAGPIDPQHAVKTLPASDAGAYADFRDYPLQKSAWAHWKPKKKSGWNIQVVWVPSTNPLANAALIGLKHALSATGKVKTLQVQQTSSVTDVAGQLQLLQIAIQRKPDLLVVFPTSATSMVPLITAAGRKGIPTVVPTTGVTGKYVVGVSQNLVLSNALSAAALFNFIGKKGNILAVHGVTGTGTDVDASKGWAAALSRCPHVHVAGSVNGEFSPQVTQSVVQQYLATHPSGTQGVLQVGTVGTSVLQAFTQTGHTPPPMSDSAASQGSLAYWHGHSSYNEVAELAPQSGLGTAAADVAIRMLEGKGVKLNLLLVRPYMLYSRAALNKVWKPSFAEGSDVGVPPPPSGYFPSSYLNGFFNKS